MRIAFERSGGFMGRCIAIEIDTNKIPVEDSRALQKMVTDSDFFNLSSESLSLQSQPDQFHYNLTIKDGDRKHSVDMDEAAIPEKLQPLIRRLLTEVRQSRHHASG